MKKTYTSPLTIAYTDQYMNWQLGSGDGSHPTNPVRAKIAVQMLKEELPKLGVNFDMLKPEFLESDIGKLLEVHSTDYVTSVTTGVSSEWDGISKLNAETAGLMFAGTARLVEKIIAGETLVGFNPQGAKHHAQRSYSSGFCVYNDMAYAAVEFQRAGLRPLYIDWDVHAGDGVQNILAGIDIPTYSIHGHGIFPNSPTTSLPKKIDKYLYANKEEGWWNYNLQLGSGDAEFMWAIDDIAAKVAEYKPGVILLATGADGHEGESWGMKYTYEGYDYAAGVVRELAAEFTGGKVLVGGAGGYQPFSHTPRIWANVIEALVE